MRTVGRSLAKRDLVIDRPHEGDQFVVDDLDDLLAGIDAREHVLPDGLGFDLGDEVVGDGEVDVGFEQRPADLAQAVADVVGREPAAAAEFAQGVLEATLNRIEHAELTERNAYVGDRILGGQPVQYNRQSRWWRQSRKLPDAQHHLDALPNAHRHHSVHERLDLGELLEKIANCGWLDTSVVRDPLSPS